MKRPGQGHFQILSPKTFDGGRMQHHSHQHMHRHFSPPKAGNFTINFSASLVTLICPLCGRNCIFRGKKKLLIKARFYGTPERCEEDRCSLVSELNYWRKRSSIYCSTREIGVTHFFFTKGLSKEGFSSGQECQVWSLARTHNVTAEAPYLMRD